MSRLIAFILMLFTASKITGYLTMHNPPRSMMTLRNDRGGNQCSSTIKSNNKAPKYDLWIVGAGTLGSLIAEEWIRKNPGSKVVAETMSSRGHLSLLELGAIPKLRSARSELDKYSAKNVVVCIPPYSRSGETSNYLEEIALSADLRSIASGQTLGNGMGITLMISSTTVYGEEVDGVVTEESPIDRGSRSSRTARSIAAEDIALSMQFSVLRLAGLYSAFRGPHMYWLDAAKRSQNILAMEPSTLVNLISYEDAARLAVKAIQQGQPGQVYMGADNHPLSRDEIVTAAASSSYFPGVAIPKFNPALGPQGRKGSKICDSTWTRAQLRWNPLYPSFKDFMDKPAI